MVVRKEVVDVEIRGADKGARALDRLGDAADDAKDELSGLGKTFVPYVSGAKRAEAATNRLGDELDRTSRKAAQLDRQMSRLGRGGRGGGAGLPGAAGGAAGGGLRAALGGLSLPVSPTTLALAGGGIAAALPAAGAAVSMAGLLAGGGAVAAGGIGLAASSNKNVQDAWKGVGSEVLGSLQSMSQVFEKPLVESARIARREWRGIRTDVGEMFDDLAESGAIEGFTRAFAGLVREALPGFRRAADELDEFAQSAEMTFPELGESISDMFDAFAKGSPGARAFFEDLVSLTGDTVEGIGNVSFGLSKIYEELDKSRDNSAFGQLTQGVRGIVLGPIVKDTENFATALERVADAAKESNDNFEKLFGNIKGQREAAIEYEEAVDELTEAFKENGKNLDIGTEKGRANQQAIQNVIDTIEQQRVAAIAAGNGSFEATQKANAAYLAQLATLETQLRKLGLTEAQIKAIIEQYKKIPTDITTTLHLRAEYQGPKPKGFEQIINLQEAWNSFLGRRAAGGPVQAGRPYLVGEEGPELITPTRSGFVHDAASTARMGSGGTTMGGASMTFGGDLNSFLAQAIMALVRTGQIVLKVGGQRVTL